MALTLYMLIGPKGSGKTHIGTIVERNTDIFFLRVENIWLKLKYNENGWKKVEQKIDMTFRNNNKIMIENLGAGEGFHQFYASLNKKYIIKLIRVFADLDICLTRVRRRDNANHIPVSDNMVIEYNKIASQVSLDWDIEIDNNRPASDSEILMAIKRLNRAAG